MMTSHWRGWTLAGLVLIACGCSKLTYERWQTVNVGTASPEAVKATLGEPWKTVNNTWVYNDPDRGVTAMVKFKDSKVVGKEWADANRGLETVGEQPTVPGDAEKIHVQQVK
jgi:hypothetical protein